MPEEQFPKPMTPIDAKEFRRRRRGRNIAIGVAILLLCVLFYAITIVQVGRGAHP